MDYSYLVFIGLPVHGQENATEGSSRDAAAREEKESTHEGASGSTDFETNLISSADDAKDADGEGADPLSESSASEFEDWEASIYTTELDKSKLTAEQIATAERLAREIETGQSYSHLDDPNLLGDVGDETSDEEKWGVKNGLTFAHEEESDLEKESTYEEVCSEVKQRSEGADFETHLTSSTDDDAKANWGIKRGLLATCHATTALHQPNSEFVATPAVKGKLMSMALPVPIIDMSMGHTDAEKPPITR